MIFSDPTGKQGLIQDITFLLGNSVDLNAYKIEDRTRNINLRYHVIWDAIWEIYTGWQFFDSNQDSEPYKDFNVVSGANEVDIDVDMLTIKAVELQDASGVWRVLVPITREQWLEMGGDATFQTTGVPNYYMSSGSTTGTSGGSVILVPAPNYTRTSACRIFADKTFTEFSISDDDVSPGFASPFHRALSVGAALDYAMTHAMVDKVGYLTQLWIDYVGDPDTGRRGRIQRYYAKRLSAMEPKRLKHDGQDLVNEFS